MTAKLSILPKTVLPPTGGVANQVSDKLAEVESDLPEDRQILVSLALEEQPGALDVLHKGGAQALRGGVEDVQGTETRTTSLGSGYWGGRHWGNGASSGLGSRDWNGDHLTGVQGTETRTTSLGSADWNEEHPTVVQWTATGSS